METFTHQIQVANTLDVTAVEHELTILWGQTAGVDETSGDDVVMRARAANLMVYLIAESALAETHETIGELSKAHPCRALVMLGETDAEARDIEMFVTAFSPDDTHSDKKQICCEEVTLSARGHFTRELPSAAVPLLVPDLRVFLWWRNEVDPLDKILQSLTRAADRVVIDSADFGNTFSNLPALAELFEHQDESAVAVSDINWARLTSWRALLANFYDVPDYRSQLENIESVQIVYVGENQVEEIAAQPLLIAGWLASRLGWEVAKGVQTGADTSFEFRSRGRSIGLDFKRVERAAMKPGRLAQIELRTKKTSEASFLVLRSEDGLHLETHAKMPRRSLPGRTLPVRNRSTAQLLAREMEILCNDRIYEQAVKLAIQMIASLKHS